MGGGGELFFFLKGGKYIFIFALSEHCAVDSFRVVFFLSFESTVLPAKTLYIYILKWPKTGRGPIPDNQPFCLFVCR